MSEMINIPISVRDVLGKMTSLTIVDCYRKYADISELLEEFDDDELIKHLGGIDKILENHPDEVQDHIANMNASQEESEKEY